MTFYLSSKLFSIFIKILTLSSVAVWCTALDPSFQESCPIFLNSEDQDFCNNTREVFLPHLNFLPLNLVETFSKTNLKVKKSEILL